MLELEMRASLPLPLLLLPCLGCPKAPEVLAASPAAPSAEQPVAAAPVEPAPVDPDAELTAWYQDMRLACIDRRTAIYAQHQADPSGEHALAGGSGVMSGLAAAGLVSWQAANDPRVNDQALALTPEAPGTPLPARTTPAAPGLYPSLPTEVQGRLAAIELAMGEADQLWRDWQEQPQDPQRQALETQLDKLRQLCTGVH